MAIQTFKYSVKCDIQRVVLECRMSPSKGHVTSQRVISQVQIISYTKTGYICLLWMGKFIHEFIEFVLTCLDGKHINTRSVGLYSFVKQQLAMLLGTIIPIQPMH